MATIESSSKIVIAVEQFFDNLKKLGINADMFYRAIDKTSKREITINEFMTGLTQFNFSMIEPVRRNLTFAMDEDAEGEIYYQNYIDTLEAYASSYESNENKLLNFAQRSLYKMMAYCKSYHISLEKLYEQCDLNNDSISFIRKHQPTRII